MIARVNGCAETCTQAMALLGEQMTNAIWQVLSQGNRQLDVFKTQLGSLNGGIS
ncbi:MAG: hypothetical protein QMC46_03995 [Burkholderiaceae bacterium]